MKFLILTMLFTKSVYAQSLRTPNELKLVGINQEHLTTNDSRAYFSSIYLIVTKALNYKIKMNHFNNSHCIELMKERFLVMYFDALKKNYNAASPWKEAFNFDGKPTTHLMLGMNAHITYDLPLSMYFVGKISTSCSPAEMKDDYFSLNDFFINLTPRLNKELKKVANQIGNNKNRLTQAKEAVISGLIVKLRNGAWNSFLELYEAETMQEFKNKAIWIEYNSRKRAIRYKKMNFLLPNAGY
jgi:hypothetical protein